MTNSLNLQLNCRRRSAVGQKVFLDVVAVRLEQHVGAAQLPDLLLGPLDHAVALAALGIEHLAGAGDLEALLGARLGLDLGHLALLFRPAAQRLASAWGLHALAPGLPVNCSI